MPQLGIRMLQLRLNPPKKKKKKKDLGCSITLSPRVRRHEETPPLLSTLWMHAMNAMLACITLNPWDWESLTIIAEHSLS